MKSSKLFTLEKSDLIVKMEKLSNRKFSNLANGNFVAVFEDYYFLMCLDTDVYDKYDFTLPKIYTALFTRFGKHNGYDDYKCSFSYCFRLTVVNGSNIYTYLLRLMDMKGGTPYFKFYRPLGEHELDKKGTYQNAIETEFSKEAMQEFILYFLGYLIGTFEGLKDTFKKPFFRTVPYASVIYGFEDGDFFEDCYYQEGDTEDENDDENDENEDKDYGYAAYHKAIDLYKNNPKMKGKMSHRYD
jgi:hypothetical protein